MMVEVLVSSAIFVQFCKQTISHHGNDCSELFHLPKEMEGCTMVQTLCPMNIVSMGILCCTLHNMIHLTAIGFPIR
jgi:hypothetical protein